MKKIVTIILAVASLSTICYLLVLVLIALTMAVFGVDMPRAH